MLPQRWLGWVARSSYDLVCLVLHPRKGAVDLLSVSSAFDGVAYSYQDGSVLLHLPHCRNWRCRFPRPVNQLGLRST